MRIHWLPEPEGGPLEPVNEGAAAQDQLRQQQQQRQRAQIEQARQQHNLQLQQMQRDQRHEARLKRRRDLRESFRPIPHHAHSFKSGGNTYNEILDAASDDDNDNENDMKGHILVGRDTRVNRNVTLDDTVIRDEEEKVDRNYFDINQRRNFGHTMKHKAKDLVPVIGMKNGLKMSCSSHSTSPKGSTYDEELRPELWESDRFPEILTPTSSVKDPKYFEGKNDVLPFPTKDSITHTPDDRTSTHCTSRTANLEDTWEETEDELLKLKDHPHFQYLIDHWNQKKKEKQIGDAFSHHENNEIFIEDPKNREMFARDVRRDGDYPGRSLITQSSREAYSVGAMSNAEEKMQEIDKITASVDMSTRYGEDSTDILYAANSPKNEKSVLHKSGEDSDMLFAYDFNEICERTEGNVNKNVVPKKHSEWSDRWSDNLSEKTEERKSVDDSKVGNKYDFLADMHDLNDSDQNNEYEGHRFVENEIDTDEDEDYDGNPEIVEEDVDDPLEALNQNPNANLNLPDRGDLDIHIAFDEVLGIRPNRPWCVYPSHPLINFTSYFFIIFFLSVDYITSFYYRYELLSTC